MDLGYRFSRSKVPRGFSYPMKRAAPSIDRSRVQESILRSVIPTALDWMVEIDHAGNVRRTGNHHFAARLIEGEALIQRD
jgi:hypothetical protein